jgi:hypothetical protein
MGPDGIGISGLPKSTFSVDYTLKEPVVTLVGNTPLFPLANQEDRIKLGFSYMNYEGKVAPKEKEQPNCFQSFAAGVGEAIHTIGGLISQSAGDLVKFGASALGWAASTLSPVTSGLLNSGGTLLNWGKQALSDFTKAVLNPQQNG